VSIVPVDLGPTATDAAFTSAALVFASAPAALTFDPPALMQMDVWERASRTANLVEILHQLYGAALTLRHQAVRELVERHSASKAHVARHIGVSPTRINQILGSRRVTPSREPAAS